MSSWLPIARKDRNDVGVRSRAIRSIRLVARDVDAWTGEAESVAIARLLTAAAWALTLYESLTMSAPIGDALRGGLRAYEMEGMEGMEGMAMAGMRRPAGRSAPRWCSWSCGP